MLTEVLLFSVIQLAFIAGFLLGRSQSSSSSDGQPSSFFAANKKDVTLEKLKKFTIDDTRFVTKVNDDKFIKNEKALGEKVVTEDDITVSVSKLAHLKKNK